MDYPETQDKHNEIQTNLYQLKVEGDGYHGSWWPEKKWRRVLAFFARFHQPGTPYRILDLGCGGMTLANALRSQDQHAEIIGVDLVIDILTRIAAKRAPDIPVVAGDIEFLPFQDASFDIVMHNQVLHHFFHREIILQEIKRVLRPGGLLESIETNGWNPYVHYEHYSRFSKIKPFISKNENPFSLPTYRREIQQTGYNILGWKMVNFDFIQILAPLDPLFGKIPLFNLVFGGSMLVCAQKPIKATA